MELSNEFTVGVPVDDAWAVLTNVELIAPCMPGAQLQEVEGDEYRGIVKVKVGPIGAQYKGTASFLEKDDDAHRAVLRAEGRDTRGQGNASATITATLEPAGDGTAVKVVTDLTVTGKVAQFGRGVLADVSAKLLTQFVECLEADIIAGGSGKGNAGSGSGNGNAGSGGSALSPPTAGGDRAPTGGHVQTSAPATEEPAGAPAAPAAGPRTITGPDAEPVDLLNTAGAPVARRVGPVIGLVVVVLWLLRRRRRRRR